MKILHHQFYACNRRGLISRLMSVKLRPLLMQVCTFQCPRTLAGCCFECSTQRRSNSRGPLHTIKSAKESRVMLGRNISISDCLINDAVEIVNEFTWLALRRNQLEVGKFPEYQYLHNSTANPLQADSKILIATFQYLQ